MKRYIWVFTLDNLFCVKRYTVYADDLIEAYGLAVAMMSPDSGMNREEAMRRTLMEVLKVNNPDWREHPQTEV